jgi:hypothetical protein
MPATRIHNRCVGADPAAEFGLDQLLQHALGDVEDELDPVRRAE